MSELDNALFLILNNHLTGTNRGILRAQLETLCNHDAQEGKNALMLFNEAHLSPENAEKLKKLLGVTQNFPPQDTLFNWIKTLSQHDYGHRHLEDFYQLLQEVKPRKNWSAPLFFATLSTAVGGSFLYLMPEQRRALQQLIHQIIPVISHFFQATFSVLKNIPLVLLIYNILSIPSQAHYSLIHDTFRSFPKRLQKWGAGTLPAVLGLISYALAYAANGVLTPLAVGFFITSSFVGVAHNLLNFYQLKPLPHTPLVSASYEEKLDYIRQKARHARTHETIGINLIASILVSMSVIFWGLLPASFFVMMGSILFINLVGFTKKTILNNIHTRGAENLQQELQAVTHEENLRHPRTLSFFNPSTAEATAAEEPSLIANTDNTSALRF